MNKKDKLLKELREGGLLDQSGGQSLTINNTTTFTTPLSLPTGITSQPSSVLTNFGNLLSNVGYAITIANKQRTENMDAQNAMGGQEQVNTLKDYGTDTLGRNVYKTPTSLGPDSFGIPLYIADQIDAGLRTIPAPDLTNYYTIAQVDTKINAIPAPDLTNYYTKTDADAAIAAAIAAVTITDTAFKTQLLRVLQSMSPTKTYSDTDRILTLSDLAGDSAGSFTHADVATNIESTPLAQFKHLPDPSALYSTTTPGTPSVGGTNKHRRSKSPKITIKRSRSLKN